MKSAKCWALILFLLAIQFASAQHKGKDVEVMSATVQDWFRGMANGGGGTTYTVKLKILTAKPVVFKNLWIDSNYAPFDLQVFTRDVDKKYTKGDSILLLHTNDSKTTQPIEKKPLPTGVKYKGVALIQFTVEGKMHYLTVDKFEKKRTIKGI